jgi:DNA-binding NarL/FixJ family response regulator
VLLIEDHAMVAEALAATHDQEPGLRVVGWLASLSDLRAYVPASSEGPRPHDVALVDYHLPDGDGIEAANLLRHSCPGASVLLVSSRRTELDLVKAIDAGCIGFVDKRSNVRDLVRAVQAAVRGEASFDADLLRAAMKTSDSDLRNPEAAALSDRERQILRLLAAGQSTEGMAHELFLSQHTVRNHIRNLTAKLGAHSRLEAVAIAARAGLVELIPPPS